MEMNTESAVATAASTLLELQNVAPAALVNIESVCRVCATVTEMVIPIFGDEGMANNLAEKICKYLPIKVSPQDALPRALCGPCARALLAWHELAAGSLRADAALRRALAAAPPPAPPAAQEPIPTTNDNEISEKDPQTKGGAPARTCDVCSLRCRQADFHDHLVAAHPDRVFLCDECHSYVDKNDILYHMSDHAYQYVAVKNEIKHDSKNKEMSIIIDNQKEQTQTLTLQSDDINAINNNEKQKKNEISNHSYFQSVGDKRSETQSILEAIHDSLDCSVLGNNEYLPRFNSGEDTDSPGNINNVRRKNDREEIEESKDENTTERIKKPKIRTCPICFKEYQASSSYFYHMKYCHDDKGKHPCGICGRTFNTAARLAKHAFVHTGESAHECDTCKKRYRSKSSLYIHEQTHQAAERAFACGQCGRAFRWRGQLARHQLRHAAERPHACAQCGRAFRVRYDLLRHARTHARPAARPRCERCGAAFAQPRYLKAHMLKKHPDGVP